MGQHGISGVFPRGNPGEVYFCLLFRRVRRGHSLRRPDSANTPEQGAVAKRAEELGAGVMLKSISEDDVMQALRTVLFEPRYRESASRISDSFRACGGVTEARAFLESITGIK